MPYITPDKLQGLIEALKKEGWAIASFKPHSTSRPEVYELYIEPLAHDEGITPQDGAGDDPHH